MLEDFLPQEDPCSYPCDFFASLLAFPRCEYDGGFSALGKYRSPQVFCVFCGPSGTAARLCHPIPLPIVPSWPDLSVTAKERSTKRAGLGAALGIGPLPALPQFGHVLESG